MDLREMGKSTDKMAARSRHDASVPRSAPTHGLTGVTGLTPGVAPRVRAQIVQIIEKKGAPAALGFRSAPIPATTSRSPIRLSSARSALPLLLLSNDNHDGKLLGTLHAPVRDVRLARDTLGR